MPLNKKTLLGIRYIRPGENTKNKGCQNLVSKHGGRLSQLVSKYYPMPNSMYENKDVIAQIYRFDKKDELIPGIWAMRLCHVHKNKQYIAKDFKFNMVFPKSEKSISSPL